MDHFAGFDRLLYPWLHRARTLALVVSAGFIEQVEHRFQSYGWNLLDANSVDFRLQVSEFDRDRVMHSAEFGAREAFSPRELTAPEEAPGKVLSEPDFSVEAVALDDGMVSLAFALREKVRVNVWPSAFNELGCPVGPWLNEAKAAMRRGMPDEHRIEVPATGTVPLGRLREGVFQITRGQGVAYVTDAADHVAIRAEIVRLAAGADHLFIETALLASELVVEFRAASAV